MDPCFQGSEKTIDNKSLKCKTITYSIHSSSSVSQSFNPENILENNPSDQASRWSSDTNTPPQFLVLQLDKPALITNITFGKYEKAHVCNLKHFKVFGGPDPDNMIEILDAGLKNDTVPESFNLKHHLNAQFYPISYLKILPLKSHGPAFNYSIWFVSLSGDDNPPLMKKLIQWHQEFRERETIRLCLKHFRQHNYLEAFQSLQKKTKIQLEDPMLTELHSVLVNDGNYDQTESLIKKCLDDGVFADYISRQQPKPDWTALILPDNLMGDDVIVTTSSSIVSDTTNINVVNNDDAEDSDGGETVIVQAAQPILPSPRGGHQLVMDSTHQNIYMFGGWDGSRDLSDFWQYNIIGNKWTMLSEDAQMDGGPGPRSCHKMVLDQNMGQIFVLGRYLERGLRDCQTNTRSDLYVYDIGGDKWTQITDDTSAMGGPNLIFDHQMCLDSEKRDIYVFGGQTLLPQTPDEERPLIVDKRFSGLYVYHIPNNSWTLLCYDGEVKQLGLPPIRSRTGHSMLFNTNDRCLYIFGGQRKRDEYLNDFFRYHVDTGDIFFLSGGLSGSSLSDSIPAVGYTQRATIDCKRNEIYVMTGLNKDKGKDIRVGGPQVSNSFWVYEVNRARWSVVYRNENNQTDYWQRRQCVEPRPRYAHQLVYDEEAGLHYMFGGNPGGKENRNGKLRLGDFWRLELLRQANTDLERLLLKEIRISRFREKSANPKDALTFLQQDVSRCIDHQDVDEQKQFQMLATQLFNQNDVSTYQLRSNLFDKLVTFFPSDMAQPTGNLVDLMPLESNKTSTSAVMQNHH